EVVTVESVPVNLVALEGPGELKRDLGSARSRRDSVIGSDRNLSFSRVGQQRESGDSRSHGSDAFDEGATLWGRRLGVPVFVLLVRYLYLLHEDPSGLVLHLLQCGLLEGQPDRRVVGILEIGPLD